MTQYSSEDWLGVGTISPAEPVPAAHHGTWTVEYTVGVAGIDDGGRIRLAFRTVSDWAAPQFTDPSGANFVTVHASRAVSLTPQYGSHGVRPWTKALTVQVGDGALAHGDRVRIVLGDRTFGSPGMRAQTYPEQGFHMKLQADPFGTGLYEPVDDLDFPVIGGQAVSLLVTAPSDAIPDEDSWLQVRALDAWGNPDPSYAGTVRFAGDRPEGCPRELHLSTG